MAKIIVDIDDEGLYSFRVCRDTKRTIASSGKFDSKDVCMKVIADFLKEAVNPWHWSWERREVSRYYYGVWEKGGCEVWTRFYCNKGNMHATVNEIQRIVHPKTPVVHTNIKNENYVRRTSTL
jgi:hypothetical protein